jgi:hypothetical protein
MSTYCTISDLQKILPKSYIIGDSVLKNGANILTSTANFEIQYTAGIIDGYLSAIYRTPLVPFKEADFTVKPVTFVSVVPAIIVLINTRLAAANLFDQVFNAEQEPAISAFGSNQRSLAFDDLKSIQNGDIQLKNQEMVGWRFVRTELLDNPRISTKPEIPHSSRKSGE